MFANTSRRRRHPDPLRDVPLAPEGFFVRAWILRIPLLPTHLWSALYGDQFHCYTITSIRPVLEDCQFYSFFSGLIQPVRYTNEAGVEQYYVDGGVVCNYPLHAFDGRWTLYTAQWPDTLQDCTIAGITDTWTVLFINKFCTRNNNMQEVFFGLERYKCKLNLHALAEKGEGRKFSREGSPLFFAGFAI